MARKVAVWCTICIISHTGRSILPAVKLLLQTEASHFRKSIYIVQQGRVWLMLCYS